MRIFTVFVLAALFSFSAAATDPIAELKSLAPYAGVWQTVPMTGGSDKKFKDVQKWEWVFGGRAMRLTHSVNDGAYAGESLIHWDGAQQKIIYRYVNTETFYTDGVITPTGDGLEVREFVRGATTGPTESLSGYRIEDGKLIAWSKFKTNGKWGEIGTYIYERAPDAALIFKD